MKFIFPSDGTSFNRVPLEFTSLEALRQLEPVKTAITESNFLKLSLMNKGTLIAEYHHNKFKILGYLIGKCKEVPNLKLPERKDLKLTALAENQARFQVLQNNTSNLFEIFDKSKGRKIGSCLKKENVPGLIEGYLKNEEFSK